MAIVAPFQIPVDTTMPLESGKYFVVGCGDIPHCICFDILSAKAHQLDYIDVFDTTGKHLGALHAEWEMDPDSGNVPTRLETDEGQNLLRYVDA